LKKAVLPQAGEELRAHDIAKMIDHSLLKPELTTDEVKRGCEIAKEYDCASVCVKPCDLAVAREILKGTDVHLSTVIAFPHGGTFTEAKLYEANKALDEGCVELDLVMNIGKMKSGEYDYVEKDLQAVIEAAHGKGAKVKVIMENFFLSDAEVKKASEIVEKAGGDWVKTSTGFAGGGATVHDLKIMRAAVSTDVQVKAAGGVRTLDAALAVRALGGTRFGCTATARIMEEAMKREAAGTLFIPADVPDDAIGY
jgi:deoxyribose-phosphate aldolase